MEHTTDVMDELITTIRKLGDSAHDRATKFHMEAQLLDPSSKAYRDLINDYFYWSGKATAYIGIAAGMELRGIVEEEMEEEGSCP